MIKLLSLFSGIGAPEQALKNIGIDYELVGFSEIDKYAIKSYCSVHGVSESLNLGDITKIDIHSLPKDIDLITHGSPCQDFSIAGKQKGGDKGAETRSSLMWNTVDIVEHCKPKYVLWENVKNLLSKKHKHNFDAYIEIMDKLGYNNYYKVLNAKDYGVPQNRERIFTISIRKDIDNNTFTFPEPFDNGLRLKDILESEVDEKFYINTEKADKLIEQFKIQKEKEFLIGGEQKNQSVKYDGISTTLTSSMGTGGGYVPMTNIYPCLTPDRLEKRQNGRRFKEDGEPMFTLTSQDKHGILQIGMLDIKGFDLERRVYDTNGISPTLNAMQGGNLQPKVLEPKRIGGLFDTDKSKHQAGSVWDAEKLSPTLDTMQGGYRQPCILDENKLKQVGSLSEIDKQGYRVYSEDGIACTQQSVGGGIGGNTGLYEVDYRIRKLTPLECWRLMGFKDEQFNKAQSVCSNSQLYKQAGNSIVVDVLEKIFENIFKSEE